MRGLSALIPIAICAALLGCGDAPKRTDTFVFAKAGDAVLLDPADVTDGHSITVCNNIFEGLLQFREEEDVVGDQLEPCLAESWEVTADTEIVFTLKADVKFHDGTTLDADDVVFSFNRQFVPDHPFYSEGNWTYWGSVFATVRKVEKVGPLQVKVTLSQSDPTFLSCLVMAHTYIISKEAAEKAGPKEYKRHPVGTGPFQFVDWLKEDHITLKRFDDYWGENALLKRLVFRVIKEPSTRMLELQAGRVHGMEYPDPENLAMIAADPNLKLLEARGVNVGYLAFNVGADTPGYEEPFGDARVRQAIAHAVNRDEIIQYLYKGTAIRADGPIPPGIWGRKQLDPIEYNPQMARDLLREAGYADGFKTTLWAMPVQRPYMFSPKQIAERIQADLKEIGIRCEIKTIEWGIYLDKTKAGEHPMCLLGWTADFADPDNFLYVLLDKDNAVPGSAQNVSFWRDDAFHELIMEAKGTYDQQRRATLYEQAQDIFAAQLPWLPMAHAKQVMAFRSDVEGYKISIMGQYYFKKTHIVAEQVQ